MTDLPDDLDPRTLRYAIEVLGALSFTGAGWGSVYDHLRGRLAATEARDVTDTSNCLMKYAVHDAADPLAHTLLARTRFAIDAAIIATTLTSPVIIGPDGRVLYTRGPGGPRLTAHQIDDVIAVANGYAPKGVK